MRAFVCDACGKMYKPFEKVTVPSDKSVMEGNAMTIVKIEKDGKMYGKGRFELCPTCMADVWDYIKIDLVQPNSPVYSKFHVGEDNGKLVAEAEPEAGSNDDPTDNPDA